MIAALFWKEWREQRTFALAVLAFGFMAMVGVAMVVEPTGGFSTFGQMGPRELMPIAVAYLAGTVCGAMLLADEKEVGTQEFLDSLPAQRRKVWQAKMLFGFVFSMGQCFLVGLIGVVLGCYDQNSPGLAWIVGAVFIGWLAFAWGSFGGATANSTLGAVFLGAFSCFFCGLLLAVPLTLLVGPSVNNFGAHTFAIYSYFLVWMVCGFLGSMYFFTKLDRERAIKRAFSKGMKRPRRIRAASSVRALLWLALRQARLPMTLIFGSALVFGGVMLLPDAQPLFMWPGITLMFGILAGVTIFSEEHGKGIARFWSERRLPIGRLWLAKTTLHFAVAVLGSIVILTVLFLADTRRPLRSVLFNILPAEQLRYLLLTLVYGFVCAHLASMLFRKTIVAGLVSIILAVSMAGALLPSLVGGGAHRWQLWLPAICVLVTARLLLYPWAHGRILTHIPLLRVTGGIAVSFLTLIGGLMYRIVEIPDMPDRLEESQFLANLPSYDANEAGNLSRSAASQFHKASLEARDALPNAQPQRPELTSTPIERLRQQGWTEQTSDLKPWMDRVFADPWLKYLDEAASKATGIFDDPRDLDVLTPLETTDHFRHMIVVLRSRGLQRQAEGAPEEFIRFVRGGLAAIRSARNKCGWRTVTSSFAAEQLLLRGIEEWLRGLDHRPDLARAMLAEVIHHESAAPVGGADLFWAEQVILRNTHTRIANWLPKIVRRNSQGLNSSTDPGDAEADFVGVCWSFPWERLRRERLQRCLSEADASIDERWFSPLHMADNHFANKPRGGATERTIRRAIDQQDQIALTLRRMRATQLALYIFRAEHGKYPTALQELVPNYLPDVPFDPFANSRRINYRLANGERLLLEFNSSTGGDIEPFVCEQLLDFGLPLGGLTRTHALRYYPPYFIDQSMTPVVSGRVAMPPPPNRRRVHYVRPGHPVLWSVGEDGNNDGGRTSSRDGNWQTIAGEDWLFVLP